MVDSTVNVIGHVLNAADESIRSVHDLAAKVFSAGARDNISLIVARSSMARTP
jgi:protein phosphatase